MTVFRFAVLSRSFLVAVVFLVLCSLFSGIACAQDPTIGLSAQIIVHVRDFSGESLAVPAVVKLSQSNGIPRGQASTQSGGEAVFSNLSVGNYVIEVTAPGYKTARAEANLMSPVPFHIEVNLARDASPQVDATPSGPPILAPKAQLELSKGLDALHKNELKEAQLHLEEANRLAPTNPEVLHLLGVLYARMGDLPRAQSVLEKALQVNPHHQRSLSALGVVLSNEAKYAEAIPKLEEALKLKDDSYETHWALARAYYHQKVFNDACVQARLALTLSRGKDPEIQLLLAQALISSGEKAKALDELSGFLRDHPDHPKVPSIERLVKRLQASH